MRFNSAVLGAAAGLAGHGCAAFGTAGGAAGLCSPQAAAAGAGVISTARGAVCGAVRHY